MTATKRMGRLTEKQIRRGSTTLILTDERALSADERGHILDIAHRALKGAAEAFDPENAQYEVCDESDSKGKFNGAWRREFNKDPENFDFERFKAEWRPELAEWEMDTDDKHQSWLGVHDNRGRIRGIVSLYNTIKFAEQKNPGRAEYTTMMAPMFDGAVLGEADGTFEAETIYALLTDTLVTEENEELNADIVEVRFPSGYAGNRWYRMNYWVQALEAVIAEKNGGVELLFVEGADGKEWLHLARRVTKGKGRANAGR